jgi:type I restriction enzyme, S subunit
MEAAVEITTSVKNVPALRFPEFEGEWMRKSIGTIATKVGSGSTPSGGEKVYQESGIPFIRSQNVNDDKLILDNVSYISEEINKKMKGSIVRPKDILLNITGGSIGRSCVVPNDFIVGNVNQHVCIIRLDKQNNPTFLQAHLSSYNGQKSLERSQVGSGREGLNFQSIRLIKFAYPTLPEQQKIASFLSAVDHKIQQLSKKKALLEKYKKGVMQQLFSQQIRFKDDNGKEYDEVWKICTIRDVTNYTKGFAFKSEDYRNYGVRIVRVSDLGADRIKTGNEKLYILTQKASIYKKYIIEEGNIIITTVGSKPEMIESAVGRGIFIKTSGEGLLNQNLLKFNNKKDIDNGFVIGHLNSKRYQHYIKTIARGNANQSNITVEDLLQFKISVPSLNEQNKISRFLAAIDDRLNYTSTQLEQAKQFKKGLLQQLFV